MCDAMMFPKSLSLSTKKWAQKGFTLMEIAVVMVLVGLMVAPAVGMYHQYRVEKDWEEIETDVSVITNAIGQYRAIYGRYPCPSSATDAPGDQRYGFEYADDCVASAPGAGACSIGTSGICKYTDATSGKDVLVGTLPYKTLNLQEVESYDTYKNRYSYAVTLDQTDNASFDLGGGGISIVDKNDMSQSLVSPAGSAHFVVVSHGKNGAGGISRAGNIGRSCMSAPAAEQENCDANSVFADGGYDPVNFDDRVRFFTAVTPAEWQISADDEFAIHLKNTDSIAVGASMSDDLSSDPQTAIHSTATNSGTVFASARFVSEQLCEYGTTATGNCFEPELIAGQLYNGGLLLEAETLGEGGMSCYRPSVAGSEDLYMAGVANSDLMCTDELYIVCPSGGSFVMDITASGEVVCDDYPENWCTDEEIVTSCGDPATLTTQYSGGHRYVYSGECRNFPEPQRSYDYGYFESQIAAMATPTEAQIRALIENINDPNGDGSYNDNRVVGDCGADYEDTDTQHRDLYYCDDGTWDWYTRHERGNYGSSWGWRWSELGYTGEDINNNRGDHDCWCREDYRVTEQECPGGPGVTGSVLVIQRHPCPQTYHNWFEIYRTELFCGCGETDITDHIPCDDYYDQVKGTSGTTGLTNVVYRTWHITCDADGNAVTPPVPTSVDTSNCACETHSLAINRWNCPSGQTNSWSWWDIYAISHNETARTHVRTYEWICPTPGPTVDSYGNVLPEPGYYGNEQNYPGPSCTCDSSLTDTELVDCSVFNKRGTGVLYLKEWDCTLNGGLGGWEDPSQWEEISNDCHECRWQEGSGPNPEDFPYGEKDGYVIGGSCSCNTDTTSQFCTTGTMTAGGKYNVWTNCPCVEQTD